jgi:2'-5' RNA ligase
LVRAFFALEVPDQLKQELAAEMVKLSSRLPKARWVKPAGIHLTLKFLGEHPKEKLERLSSEVQEKTAGNGEIVVNLGGSGFFPSPSRGRVAWIGGRAEGAREIAEIIDRAATRLGVKRERRPWALHLTLARLRQPWSRECADLFLDWGKNFQLDSFTCDEAVLFESRLEPTGAVYTVLERVPLK